jgi:hypothetical protein
LCLERKAQTEIEFLQLLLTTFSPTDEAKLETLFKHGHLLNENQLQQFFNCLNEKTSLCYIATESKVFHKDLVKEDLRSIEKACQIHEKNLQSAKLALQIKTSKQELSFNNTSYVFCKLLVANSMMSKVDLAVAYIRKAMLALSNYPKLQLKMA